MFWILSVLISKLGWHSISRFHAFIKKVSWYLMISSEGSCIRYTQQFIWVFSLIQLCPYYKGSPFKQYKAQCWFAFWFGGSSLGFKFAHTNSRSSHETSALVGLYFWSAWSLIYSKVKVFTWKKCLRLDKILASDPFLVFRGKQAYCDIKCESYIKQLLIAICCEWATVKLYTMLCQRGD